MNEELINLKLMVVISKLGKSLELKVSPEIRHKGLTFTQFTVLEAILHKGPQTVNDVITKAHSSSGNMGLVINNLIKSGFIVKEVSKTDKRARLLDLTSSGRELIRELYPSHVKTINSLMGSLDISEKVTLVNLMKKLGLSLEGE